MQFDEIVPVDTERVDDGRQDREACSRRSRPVSVRTMSTLRSSSPRRRRSMSPFASSRLSSGDRVAESSCRTRPMSPTALGSDSPQRQHHQVLRVGEAERVEQPAVDPQHRPVGDGECETHLAFE